MYHKVGLVYTIWLWLTVCHGKSPFLRTVKLYFYGLFPMALVPFQSTWLAHFPDDLMVKYWHAQAARMAWWSRTTSKQELAFELGKFMKAQPLRTAVFWSFQQLGIGDFRIFLSSKSGISWNFTIKTWDFTVKTTIKHWDFMGFDSTMKKWDFMGFHGISWDFMGFWWNLDGGLYIVGVIFVGFVTIVDNFTPRTWEMICVKELDPPCSWEASESHKFKDEFCAFEVHCGHSEVEVPFIQCLGAFWSVAQGPKLFRYKTSPWPIPVGKWLKKRFFLAPYANRVGRILSSYHWGSIPRVKNTSDLGSTEHVPFFPTGMLCECWDFARTKPPHFVKNPWVKSNGIFRWLNPMICNHFANDPMGLYIYILHIYYIILYYIISYYIILYYIILYHIILYYIILYYIIIIILD